MSNNIDTMFEAGAHFGYSKTRRHPSTAPFIFGTKNRVDIIDLEKTEEMLKKACEFVKTLGKENKIILFVGAKPESRNATQEGAFSIDMPYVTERWIGGTITNFGEIKKRINKLEDLREKKEKGELEKYTKKERLLIDIEIERLNRFFGGLVHLKKTPDAVFIVDTKREHVAVAELQNAGVPIVALANTDTNIKGLEYPILANDASLPSISFFVGKLVEAYKEGKMSNPN